MATIKDIAKLANVSTATVSMVLNGKDGITKKTREKVIAAAKTLEYVPSVAAKTLKTNRSYTIALFVGDITNPFFPEIIKGVEAAARERGYSVIIYNLSGHEPDYMKQIERAASQRVDGFFITGGTQIPKTVKERLLRIIDSGVKIVSSNIFMDWDGITLIKTTENEQIEALLSKLVAFGHNHIGCVSGYPEYWVAQERENVYRKVLQQYGVFHPEYIVNGGFYIEDGKNAAKKLLKSYPQISAIMCVNDTLAIGCNAAAIEMGREIPSELSIFGVDGIECLRYFKPELTTVDTHRYEYGYNGTMRLLDMIEDDGSKMEFLKQPLIGSCSIRTGDTVAAKRENKRRSVE